MRIQPMLFVGLITAAGCDTVREQPALTTAHFERERSLLSGSLFPSDQQVMSNEAIDQVLSSHIQLPERGRIAILRFGEAWGRWWWSEELSRLDQENIDRLTGTLRACSRVGNASLLPSMLTPEKQTVPLLREAAARYQADLILLYRSTSYTFEKQRFLAPDEAKSYCLVEAVLLDVRTGVVPFTATVVQDYSAQRSRDDLNFAETIRRSELQALGQALDRIAADLVEFLETVPPPERSA